MSEELKTVGLTVHGDDKLLQGRYANAFSVTSQERDVAIDFISHVNIASQPAQLVSRIFLNHFTARELIQLMQQTLAEWEKARYERVNNAPESKKPDNPSRQ